MSNVGIFLSVLVGLVVAGGWATAEYNYRITAKRNKEYKEKNLRLEKQAEELHKLLAHEKAKADSLAGATDDAIEFRQKFERLESEHRKVAKELNLMEKTLLGIRQRASSKEYMGNALGKVITAHIDNLFPSDKEKAEEIAEGAKKVFKRIRKSMGE